MSRGPEPAGRSGIGSSNSRFQPRLGTWAPVRRHPLASIEAPIFLCRKIPLAAPFLKISVGSIGQKHSPCILEFDAGLVERGRGAIRTFPRVAAGIKTAIPASRIFTRRHSGADRDRAHAHVTVMDVPTFVGSIGRSTAGGLGHGRYQSATAPWEQYHYQLGPGRRRCT